MSETRRKLNYKDLIAAGVHFGHPRTRRCPKMDPNVWGTRNDIQLIDVSKTVRQAEKASQFLQATAAEGKTILWIGTKKSARDGIKRIAEKLDMPYVNHRWIGGSLTNYDQVKKSITKFLHYKDVLAKTDKASTLYTKKEFNVFQKIVERLDRSVGGICSLKSTVGALVVVDVRKERSAVKEAHTMNIPVVALVDTDGDPSLVEYVIPANDDAPRSVTLLLDYLAEGAALGKEQADKNEELRKIKTASKEADASAAALGFEDKRLLEEELDATEAAAANKPGASRTFKRGPVRRGPAGGGDKPRTRPSESYKKSE